MQDAKKAVKTNQNQVVTAVGNSWIICKSKTYEGKTYYFNTQTGVATWNLSDVEIEKAKKRTHCLDKQSEQSLNECPEPKEPPMDNLNQRSQYIYNKKVINNRFTNEPGPVTAFVTPQCNYVVPKCSSGNQIGLNLPSQNYNPEVWTVPPTHQILIAPAGSPIISQSKMPVNVQYSDRQHMPVENASVPLTRWFQNDNSSFNNPRYTSPKYYTRGHKFSPRMKFQHAKFQRDFQDKPSDLREFINRKRRKSITEEDNRDITDANDSRHLSSNEERELVPGSSYENKIQERKDDAYLSDTENSRLEANFKLEDTKLDLDVTCLRKLAAPKVDPDIWYIAVDRTILLHHLKYLNMLINSDEECKLLVPREELEALREMVRSSEVVPRLLNRAQRAIDFVLHQFDLLGAVQGEELETSRSSSHILNCCLNVAEQNCHVILLSNDTELLAQKDSTNITMFSMNELKDILNKSNECDTIEEPSAPVLPERPITITISNEYSKETSTNETFETISSLNTEELPKQDNRKKPENIVEVKSTLNSLSTTKVTVDTGVQTDFTMPTVEVKRREIKLKRSTSNQTSNNQSFSNLNSTTKQYRWRKKRNACSKTNAASNETDSASMNNITSTSEAVEKSSDVDSGQQASQLSAESDKNNCIFDENIEGSDTSSSVCIQKTVNERIIIEETSTSGVISNTTASNQDAESVINEFPDQLETRLNCNTAEHEDNLKNNYMFEITSPQIEEYLQMRRDEWISRFVQIMEEVLSQVLQKKNTSYFHLTPPPWTLQEALQCILRSSDYCSNVKDAAQKLSRTLFKISDEKDKINMELRPADFMEMYSYGVYLVAALQRTDEDCEDIQTASDSLVKLMNDIQEPNLDTSNNDAFCGQNQDVSLNDPLNTETPDNSMNVDNAGNEVQNTHYNLRSKRTTRLQQNESSSTDNLKSVRNDYEENFFNSLNLQKIISQNIGESSQGRERTSQEFNFERPSKRTKESNESKFAISDNLERVFNKKYNEVETSLVRRFSKSLEFENCQSQREPLDLDQLDYDDNDECMEDLFYDKGQDEFDDRTFTNSTLDNTKYMEERYPTLSPDIKGDTVRGIIQTFIKEITDTFTQVQVFCNEADQQLRKNGQLLSRRKSIHNRAKKNYLCIENIITSLKSIIYRETHQREDGMHSLLKEASIAGLDLKNKPFSYYRASIVKCLNQANILLEMVGLIMSATKT